MNIYDNDHAHNNFISANSTFAQRKLNNSIVHTQRALKDYGIVNKYINGKNLLIKSDFFNDSSLNKINLEQNMAYGSIIPLEKIDAIKKLVFQRIPRIILSYINTFKELYGNNFTYLYDSVPKHKPIFDTLSSELQITELERVTFISAQNMIENLAYACSGKDQFMQSFSKQNQNSILYALETVIANCKDHDYSLHDICSKIGFENYLLLNLREFCMTNYTCKKLVDLKYLNKRLHIYPVMKEASYEEKRYIKKIEKNHEQQWYWILISLYMICLRIFLNYQIPDISISRKGIPHQPIIPFVICAYKCALVLNEYLKTLKKNRRDLLAYNFKICSFHDFLKVLNFYLQGKVSANYCHICSQPYFFFFNDLNAKYDIKNQRMCSNCSTMFNIKDQLTKCTSLLLS